MNTKTVLKFSSFTSDLTRTLKSEKSKLHCHVDADGSIYVCTNYFVVKLNTEEYDALVRPVSQRDAGDWVLDEKRQLIDVQPIDMAKCLNDTAKEATYSVTAAPFLFNNPARNNSKFQILCYYSEEGDFAAGFNPAYNAIVSAEAEHKSSGTNSPMVVYAVNEPIAMILPIRISDKPEIIRTVRAWFTGQTKEKPHDKKADELRRRADDMEQIAKQREEENRQLQRDNEGLRQEYGKLHSDCSALQDQIEELKAALASKNEQIEALTERLNAQAVDQPQETPANDQPQDKTAALIEKLSVFPNVTATVKGAQTAAPVVWLAGDTDAHKAEIEKLGGRWSGKRSAWYFKI